MFTSSSNAIPGDFWWSPNSNHKAKFCVKLSTFKRKNFLDPSFVVLTQVVCDHVECWHASYVGDNDHFQTLCPQPKTSFAVTNMDRQLPTITLILISKTNWTWKFAAILKILTWKIESKVWRSRIGIFKPN